MGVTSNYSRLVVHGVGLLACVSIVPVVPILSNSSSKGVRVASSPLRSRVLVIVLTELEMFL